MSKNTVQNIIAMGFSPEMFGKLEPQKTITGKLTSGSPIVTEVSDTSNITAGDIAEGNGIPDDTTVLSVDSDTQITLSNDASATGEDVSITASSFPPFISTIIDEQADLLQGRLGSDVYGDETEPNATYIKRAEKGLIAAEMMQARIIYITGNAVPNGEEPDTRSLDRQKKDLKAEAEEYISRLVSGAETDSKAYSGSVLVSGNVSPLNIPRPFYG